MSANRYSRLLFRLQRHFSSRAACTCAGRSHESGGVVPIHNKQQADSGICFRNFSSNTSTPKPPDTSLFVPVSLKVDSSLDGGVGAELSKPLDRSEYTHLRRSRMERGKKRAFWWSITKCTTVF